MASRDATTDDGFRDELEREAPAIYAWVYATLSRFRATSEAADFAQEVYVRALVAEKPKSGDIANRRAWFFGIARRTLLEWIRARAERKALGLVVGDGGRDFDAIVQVASGVSRRVAKNEQVAKLLEIVREFEGDDLRVIVEYLIEGRTSEQVARDIAMTSSGVRAAARRLRATLVARAPFAADYFVE